MYFFFYFHYSGMWVIGYTAVIYVREILPMFSSRTFIDSFAVKNLISVIRSHLFILGFISIILGGES